MKRAPVVASMGLLALMIGCSRGDHPPLGTVSGTVTMGGKPLSKATVSFHPVDGGRQSYSHTDEEGRYELIFIRDIMGAKVGKHKVTIRTAGAEDTDKAHTKERVPVQYNDKTTLEREVKSGANQFDFELLEKAAPN